MIELAISDNPDFEVSSYEIDSNTNSYTYYTILHFKKTFQNKTFYYILGEDSFLQLPQWYNYQKLVELVVFLVAPREGRISHERINFKCQYHIINSPKIEISSTLIRYCIRNKKGIKYLVPDKVIDYIYRENVYGGLAFGD